jgi:hypothetical protein
MAKPAKQTKQDDETEALALLHEIRDLMKILAAEGGDLNDLTAGNAFRQSLVERADADKHGAPLWHGWALMEAFLAGAEYARGLQKLNTSK